MVEPCNISTPEHHNTMFSQDKYTVTGTYSVLGFRVKIEVGVGVGTGGRVRD